MPIFQGFERVLREKREEEDFQNEDTMMRFSSSLSLLIISPFLCDFEFFDEKLPVF